MDQRPLGNTGLSVSTIGFGAFKIGRNEKIKYPSAYDLPDMPQVERLLNRVLELGINYLDTAPAYGVSEERLGAVLAPRRGEFVLSTKVGEIFEHGESRYDFTGDHARRSIEQSLRRLRCDHVDLLLIHATGDELALQRDGDLIPTLQNLKQRGLTRAIGFSGKSVAGAEHALNWADVLMVEYNLQQREHEAVIAQAQQRGLGVVVKKGLGSGWLDPAAAIAFVLGNPGVASIVIGGLNADHLAANVAVAGRIQSGK